ncbi:MAG: hypothetical protein NC827_06010 [Candidatus Omnitrophica bacterium]|nr:hypothetical protein [Candidatus Omnitrophota bacterium]
MDIDKLIEKKYSEHQKELYELEKKLEEYIDLKNEKEIKIEEGYYKFVKSLKILGFEHWGYSEPPIMKRRYPIMPSATNDWDFNTTSWALDTSIYVSSPSSLRATGVDYILCKYTGTTVLPQGRITTYFKGRYNYHGTPCWLGLMFRNQTAIGSAGRTNTYLAVWASSSASPYSDFTLYIDVNGTLTTLYQVSSYLDRPDNLDVWNEYRLTWWTDLGGAGLMVRFEFNRAGTWKKILNDLNHSANQWVNSTINRCGFGHPFDPTYYMAFLDWVDDTIIWGP